MKSKFNFSAAIAAALFAGFSIAIFAWLFYSFGLYQNTILATLAVFAIACIVILETATIYGEHKSFIAERHKHQTIKSKAKA